MKTARRQAREIALQALYAWQLSGDDALEQARTIEGFERDAPFVEALLRGVSQQAPALQQLITPHLSRTFERLSPVERAILYIATFELQAHPETPFKVVLNEAIELGKSFGGAEGHRFVNGALEKIAAAIRPEEVAKASRTA
jgi:N utilization substance protein B